MISSYQSTAIALLTSILFAANGRAQQPMQTEVAAPYSGRTGAAKDKLLQEFGGNVQTEAAVARGLAWLGKQQKNDGGWEFDGASKSHRVAATGLAPWIREGWRHRERPMRLGSDQRI